MALILNKQSHKPIHVTWPSKEAVSVQWEADGDTDYIAIYTHCLGREMKTPTIRQAVVLGDPVSIGDDATVRLESIFEENKRVYAALHFDAAMEVKINDPDRRVAA